MTSPTDDRRTAVINAWIAWDRRPESRPAVVALEDTIHALVGPELSRVFRAHVAAKRHQGHTIAEAVTTWR
jgi:hypothetical protein